MENSTHECPQCKKRMLGYSDIRHQVYLCWKCGKFDGKTMIDDDFTKIIMENPMTIMYLIQNKLLKPIP